MSYPTFNDAYGQIAAAPPPLEAKMDTQAIMSPWDTLDQPASGAAAPQQSPVGMAEYKGK